MASFEEIPNSRESTIEPPSFLYHYRASGWVSDTDARVNALALTPANILDPLTGVRLYRQDIKCSPAGHGLHLIDVPYGPNKKETGELSWTFSTSGGTLNVKAAKQHIATYPAGGDANPHKGLIGLTKDGNIEGCEITIPVLKLSYTFKHPLGVITETHARALASYTGMVSSTVFRGFAAGEILFLGANGSDGTESEASVTYEFAASQNVVGLTIGTIEGIAKKGWEYLWIEYEDAVDGGGAKAVNPTRVHVERVYESIDFAAAFGWG